MTDPKAAAERIKDRARYMPLDPDYVALADYVLSLTDKDDAERAREIAIQCAHPNSLGYAQIVDAIFASYAAVRAAERERCAGIADECDTPFACPTSEEDSICDMMGKRIAASIRGGDNG